MRVFYVYILECSDDSYYIGITNDVGRRFIEHSSGLHETAYTYKRRPLKLVFCRQFRNPSEAIRYEKQLKGWTKAKKMALINNDLEMLHEFAACKNNTSHKNHNGSR